ncbi:MAG: low molecular weight phosphotyrosine protein phosphatase [Bacteroidales bacterium]|nr:low molecular weight phosphotyrosine protein phosphatase [Bacteroidales bacterium]
MKYSEKIKILFVCLGNICRSPMAEFVMKDIVEKERLSHEFEIASAATSTYEIGNPVYPPARQKLAEHGICCAGKTARQITKKDYEYYDYIVAMDQSNIRNLKTMLGDDKQGKISLLMDYTSRPADVADPWYTGDFQATWEDVNEGCKELLTFIMNKNK